MYAKIAVLARRFWRWIVGFISLPWVICLVSDLLQDRRDNFINQLIDKAVSKVAPFQYLTNLLSWFSENPILATILTTGTIIVVLHVAAYFETRKQSKRGANIQGEILAIILENKPDADFLSVGIVTKVATLIAMQIKITNFGPVTVQVIDWSLEVQVGNVRAIAERREILPQMKIKKPTTPFEAEQIVPVDSLDRKLREGPLRQDASLDGWLLFELPTVDIPDPTNGRLSVRIVDSLGQTHEIIREASPFPLSGKLAYGKNNSSCG